MKLENLSGKEVIISASAITVKTIVDSIDSATIKDGEVVNKTIIINKSITIEYDEIDYIDGKYCFYNNIINTSCDEIEKLLTTTIKFIK